MPAQLTVGDYDGTAPFPDTGQPPSTVQGWLTPAHLDSRRRDPGRDQPQPALQPGERRTGRGAVPACRVSPLPASSGRLR
jgi:hypothetical protein